MSFRARKNGVKKWTSDSKARPRSCLAQRGIGFAIAAALATEGARVVVDGRTGARVTAAPAQIRQRVNDADVGGVAADLGTSAGVKRLL